MCLWVLGGGYKHFEIFVPPPLPLQHYRADFFPLLINAADFRNCLSIGYSYKIPGFDCVFRLNAGYMTKKLKLVYQICTV